MLLLLLSPTSRLILDLEGGVLKLQLAADTFEGMAMAERQKRLGQVRGTGWAGTADQ
jgi:hypothetical protein